MFSHLLSFKIELYKLYRRSDLLEMQKKLEKKLSDAKKAHSELRVVIRENQQLEQENIKYTIQFLKHCRRIFEDHRLVMSQLENHVFIFTLSDLYTELRILKINVVS